MCIVADSVKDISGTKIASFHVAYTNTDKDHIMPAQLIIYSANVDSLTNSNAFILPVYNPGNITENIIPLDFSKIPDFFIDLERIFDRWFPKKTLRMGQAFTNSYDSNNDSFLEVHRVGDYKFSIMPSKMDFNRIDRSQLNINPLAKVAIDVHSQDYSFIVYQFFQKGKIDVSPFGYLCPPAGNNTMLIPTIHGHPHDSLLDLGSGYTPNLYVSYKSDFEEQADFDHDIYGLIKSSQPNNIINKQDIIDLDNLLKQINRDYLKRNIRIYIPKNFIPKKLKFTGYRENRNLLLDYQGHYFVHDLTID